MAEIWKPIPGYEGSYEVSSQGLVRGLDRDVIARNGSHMHIKGCVLKPRMVKDHLGVTLWRDNTPFHTYVHTVVALTFLGPRPEKNEVRHLNGDIYDNRVVNLAYGTSKENKADAHSYGGKQGTQKLSVEEVQDIRKRLRNGDHPDDIAREFGVSRSAIYHIRRGTNFKWLPEEVT